MKFENLTEDQKQTLLRTLSRAESLRIAKLWHKGQRTIYYWREELMKMGLEDQVIRDYLKTQSEINLIAVSNKFNVAPIQIQNVVESLQKEGKLIDIRDGKVLHLSELPAYQVIKIDIQPFFGTKARFGVVSDTHLNSKYERLDVLNALYDMFEREGIKTVLHAGNIIDGFCRLNQFDVWNSGVDEQIGYLIKNYPIRKDFVTHFITANDHEGWYIKQNHVNIGKNIENTAIGNGRKDLHYLGHIEADVEIKIGERPTIIRVFHPGRGSAYAKSYKPQKIIESFAGGEKPDFLVIGHYHKSGWDIIRNVPYVGAGCTTDQSPYLRTNPTQVDVGGYIVELRIDEAGNVRRVIPEWFIFYNKGFYKKAIVKKYEKVWEYRW